MREHALPLPPAHLLVALNGGTEWQNLRDEHFNKELCQDHCISLHIEHFGTRLVGTL